MFFLLRFRLSLHKPRVWLPQSRKKCLQQEETSSRTRPISGTLLLMGRRNIRDLAGEKDKNHRKGTVTSDPSDLLNLCLTSYIIIQVSAWILCVSVPHHVSCSFFFFPSIHQKEFPLYDPGPFSLWKAVLSATIALSHMLYSSSPGVLSTWCSSLHMKRKGDVQEWKRSVYLRRCR